MSQEHGEGRMGLGTGFLGLVVVVGALGLVFGLRRRRPASVDPDQVLRASKDVGWAANYTPKPVNSLPADFLSGDLSPTPPQGSDLLEDYLFDPDELRSLGRDAARRRLRSLHLPASQLEEVLDTIFHG
jgi:hypothetical protein